MKRPKSIRSLLVPCALVASGCMTSRYGPPVEYALTDELGEPVAEARVRTTHFDLKSLNFWASVENHCDRTLLIESELRLEGRPDVVFAPGRFAPLTTTEVPAGRSFGAFLVFDLPSGFSSQEALGGALELELRAKDGGALLASVTRRFPVPPLELSNAGGVGGYDLFTVPQTSPAHAAPSAPRTATRPAAEPKSR